MIKYSHIVFCYTKGKYMYNIYIYRKGNYPVQFVSFQPPNEMPKLNQTRPIMM